MKRFSEVIRGISCSVVAFLAISAFGTASAADYPCSSVEWIVGWGAGGGSDSFARSMAPGVADTLGVPVRVINMPGASSIVAQEEVLNRPADGCTIFSITPDQLTNEITGLTELSHTDLQPIMRAHVDIGMMHARKGGEFGSWDDVIAYAKDNPGELLVGGTGAASFDEIVVNIVFGAAGVEFRYIPYEASKEMHADLLGGRLHVVYDEVSVLAGMIEAGQVAPLIVLAESELEKFPGVQAARDLGYQVPPSLWRGAAVKGGTPADVVKMLEGAFMAAADTEAYQTFEEGRLLNLYPGRLGADGFAELLAGEHKMYADVISGLNAN